MDVLSEVLKVVKLQGAMFYNGEFSAPWSFRSPASCNVAPFVAAGAEHVIIYHLLTEGRASARVEDGVQPGDHGQRIAFERYGRKDVNLMKRQRGHGSPPS